MQLLQSASDEQPAPVSPPPQKGLPLELEPDAHDRLHDPRFQLSAHGGQSPGQPLVQSAPHAAMVASVGSHSHTPDVYIDDGDRTKAAVHPSGHDGVPLESPAGQNVEGEPPAPPLGQLFLSKGFSHATNSAAARMTKVKRMLSSSLGAKGTRS